MLNYILRRLLLVPLLLIGITLVVFILIQLAPGDPVTAQYGLKLAEADPVRIERLREELGLNDPIMVQYVRYLGNLLKGDFGISLTTRTPVLTEIAARFPATLELTLAAMLIVIVFSIPLGIAAALKRGSLLDNGLMAFSLFGVSMPAFWLGIMLILLFSLTLGWLPTSGRGTGPLLDRLEYLVLPAVTLGFAILGLNSRIMRSSMIEVLNQDYIRTAHGKGQKRSVVIIRHALRNALVPILTLLGVQFASLLGGAVIIEMIFAWPGLGRLAVNATMRRDYPVIMGTVLLFSFFYLISSLVVDIVYTLVDPRIRYE
ncbi:MAG TPA: ABC transporter permease [Anaerolineaceae bacterium]|nr:ABC transporter permease [Anaerolineaceae bacterium]